VSASKRRVGYLIAGFVVILGLGRALYIFQYSANFLSKEGTMRKWSLYGPLNELSEKTLTESGPAMLLDSADAPGPIVGYGDEVITSEGLVDLKAAIGLERTEEPTHKSFLAKATIISFLPTTAYLCFGGDDLLRVWLKDRLVYSAQEPQKYYGMQHGIQIHLDAGNNDLYVESTSVSEGSQRFRAMAGLDAIQVTNTFLDEAGPLVSPVVVASQKIALPCLFAEIGAKVTVSKQASGRAIEGTLTGRQWIPKKPIIDGVYRVSVQVGKQSYAASIYIGDAISKALLLMDILRQSGQTVSPDAQALERRFEVLLNPENRLPNDYEWQSKIVWTIGEAERIANSDNVAREEEINPLSGIHLNGFVSGIDGQYLFYRISLPEGPPPASGYPVAVLIPTNTNANRAFIDSVYIARQIEAERWNALANKYKTAILWMGYRVQPYGNENEFTYFDEVLGNVSRRYSIDRSKIAIMGTCRAGMTVLMFAERWPSRFSALGVIDPIIDRSANRSGSYGQFVQFKAYNDWLAARDPILNIDKIAKNRLFIVHDSTEFGHGTLSEAQNLFFKTSGIGAQVELKQIESSVLHLGAWDYIIRNLSGSSRPESNDNPSLPIISPDGVLSGAINRPFVMVSPSILAPYEKGPAKALVDHCCQLWANANHTACRLITDTEVTVEIERNYNLLIIGNSKTNLIWKKYERNSRIKVRGAAVFVDGRQRLLDNPCGITAVQPNPLFPNRSIVFIGGFDIPIVSIGNFDWDVDGWFDYAIWTKQGEGVELAIAERW